MLNQQDLFQEAGFSVDWLHATHAGGKGEYLHDWYAYLEGYSSEFVRSVCREYLAGATKIIDPFAGVGTTPITLALAGFDGYYCEVNPVLRKVIDTKISVAALPRAKKNHLQQSLTQLAEDLPGLVREATAADDLRVAHEVAFKKSKFFSDDAFEEALRLRGLNDEILRTSPLLGASLQIAVMSKLVECSLLKRAGDVRYKTKKELERGVPRLVDSVCKQLLRMADDSRACPKMKSLPKILTPNAKDLCSIPSVQADGVITSPPYLNGTNYFRNTKLELWYLRQITSDRCLRAFRDGVLTSAINDVTRHTGKNVPSQAAEVYQLLEERAYDKRIAKMVAAYFDQMSIVLQGLAHHLVPGARLCIDIGDSIYSGIHVKTHEILTELAKHLGMQQLDMITLRERRSHNGASLSQTLIVLELPTSRGNKHRPSRGTPQTRASNGTSDVRLLKWDSFKETLPHMRHPYSKRNWGSPLHSVCSYQGKMKPSLAFHLVDVFSSLGDVILDPFSGSGTIPFEAALNGRSAIGFDIGLLATAISNAKIQSPKAEAVEALLEDLSAHIRRSIPSKKATKDAEEVKFNKSIREYFHEDTYREILCARDFFADDPAPEDAAWSLVFSCMLHVLHGNRPYALSRRSHPLTPYAPSGEFTYKSVMDRLRAKVQRSLAVDRGDEFLEGRCYQADILGEWPITPGSVDAVITSPPFFDSTRFYMTNWMRYWFSGWSKSDFATKSKAFIEQLQKESLEIYDAIFRQCVLHLREQGIAVFHLGHSDKCDMAEELKPIAVRHLKLQDVFTETVEHCESHGVSDKGRIKGHQYMILKK